MLALEFLLTVQSLLPISFEIHQLLGRVMEPLLRPLSETLVNVFNRPASTYPLDVLRVLVALPVFLYASYRDVKERLVRDVVWVPLYVFGLLFLLIDLTTGDWTTIAPWVAGNLIFAIVIGYILYWTHLFGGADRKALIGLALLFPTYPLLIVFPLVTPPILEPPMNAANMFSLTILANTALIAILFPLYTLFNNLRDRFEPTRPGLMLTAERVPLEETPSRHGKILLTWDFDSNGLVGRFLSLIRTIRYGIDTQFLTDYLEWHNSGTDGPDSTLSDLDHLYIEEFLNSDANHTENGEPIWMEPDSTDIDEAEESILTLLDQDEVWMTPGIPFLVPMTLGLLLSLTIGDVIYWVVMLLN